MIYHNRHDRLWERYDEAAHGNAQQMHDILVETLDALEQAELEIHKLQEYAEEEANGSDKAAASAIEWMNKYKSLKNNIKCALSVS